MPSRSDRPQTINGAHKEAIAMMFFGGWMMMIVWIVIAALIIWGIVALARRNSSTPETRRGKDALEIAQGRYAKGEISKEQFDEIKEDLS